MSECKHEWEWIQHLDVAWYECKHCDAVLNPERAEVILNEHAELEAKMSKYLSEWGMGPAPLLKKISALKMEVADLQIDMDILTTEDQDERR